MVAPTFSKKERIVSKKLMETLFEKGDSQAVTQESGETSSSRGFQTP